MWFPRSNLPSDLLLSPDVRAARFGDIQLELASGQSLHCPLIPSVHDLITGEMGELDLLLIEVTSDCSEADRVLLQESAWLRLKPNGVLAQVSQFASSIAHPIPLLRASVPSNGGDVLFTTYRRP